MQTPPLFSGRSWLAMDESDTSSTFTCSSLHPSPDPECDEHNMWNPTCGTPCWDFFCHVQVGVFVDAYFDEVDVG